MPFASSSIIDLELERLMRSPAKVKAEVGAVLGRLVARIIREREAREATCPTSEPSPAPRPVLEFRGES